jgi:hypothetical protein
MKQFDISIAVSLLLFSTATIAQTKKNSIPPPTVIQVEKPAPPPPPEIKNGHPWTRNGENVWVAKPTIKLPNGKWVSLVPPPPPPSKVADVEKPALPGEMKEAIPAVPQKPAKKVMPPPPPPVPAKKENE